MLQRALLLLFPAALLLLATPVSAADGAGREYEAVKSRYMKLRNTDRGIKREKDWNGVIADLLAFAERNHSSRHAPVALSQAGAMLLEMHSVLNNESYLERAKSVFSGIVTRFPQSNQADDALFKLSEISNNLLKDREQAVIFLQRIINEYPKGDMYEAARYKLASLTGQGREKPEPVVPPEAEQPLGKKVIIDPGHGGEDFGAVGVGGLYEKDVVLDISLKLKDFLRQKYKLNAVLTRETDRFLPLYERTAFANEQEGAVFVSVHANASEKKNLQGLEVYYLDNTSDKASRRLAERENASMQFEGPEADLRYMLSDLIQDSKMKDSVTLASVLSKTIPQSLKDYGFSIRNHGIKKAPFYVLVGAYMPCVLVEIGFIDHAEEGLKLAEKNFRLAAAEALAGGITRYLER